MGLVNDSKLRNRDECSGWSEPCGGCLGRKDSGPKYNPSAANKLSSMLSKERFNVLISAGVAETLLLTLDPSPIGFASAAKLGGGKSAY